MSVSIFSLQTSSSSSIIFGFNPQVDNSYYYIRKKIVSRKYSGYAKNGMNLSRAELGALIEIVGSIFERSVNSNFSEIFKRDNTSFKLDYFEINHKDYLVVKKSRNYRSSKIYWTTGLAVPLETLDSFLGNLTDLYDYSYEELMKKYKESNEYIKIRHIIKNSHYKLNQKEIRLLSLVYGVDEDQCYTIERIAYEFGVSRAEANKILNNALEKLHKN